MHQDPINVVVKERRVLEEALQETTTILGMEYDDDRVSVLHDHDVEESSSIQNEGLSSSEGEEQIKLEQATTTVREKKRLLR